MLLKPSRNSLYKMNKENLLTIVDKMKILVNELESELKSNVGSYSMGEDDYEEILKYIDTNDDDGEEGLWWDRRRILNY